MATSKYWVQFMGKSLVDTHTGDRYRFQKKKGKKKSVPVKSRDKIVGYYVKV